MDEDTPDEIADKMNQADYLKEKHKETFKEEVRQVCLKAKTQLESGKIEHPKHDHAVSGDSVSSTSIHKIELQKEEDPVQQVRIEEINNSETASQVGSPRGEQAADQNLEQQIESGLTSPTPVFLPQEDHQDLPASASKHQIEAGNLPTNPQLLQRSPSGSSIASVGSIGSLQSTNMTSRAGQPYSAKDTDALLTSSLNNHFAAGAGSSQTPAPAAQNPVSSDSKTDKDTSSSEHNTLTSSSRPEPLLNSQESSSMSAIDSQSNGNHSVAANPPVMAPAAQSVVSQSDVPKEKLKRLNAKELDKQLTTILSHPQRNPQISDLSTAEGFNVVPVVIPVAVAGTSNGVPNQPPVDPAYLENSQGIGSDLYCPYPNPAFAPASQQYPGSTKVDQTALPPSQGVVPMVIALGSTPATLTLPLQVSSAQITSEFHDVRATNDAGVVSDVESVSGFADAQRPTVSDSVDTTSPVGAPPDDVIANDNGNVQVSSNRFQVSRVVESVAPSSEPTIGSGTDASEQAQGSPAAVKPTDGCNKPHNDIKDVAEPQQTIGRFKVTAITPVADAPEPMTTDTMATEQPDLKEEGHTKQVSRALEVPVKVAPDTSLSRTSIQEGPNPGEPEQLHHPPNSAATAYIPPYVGVPVAYHQYPSHVASVGPITSSSDSKAFDESHPRPAFPPSFPAHLVMPGLPTATGGRDKGHPPTKAMNLAGSSQRPRTLSNNSDKSVSSHHGEFLALFDVPR